LNDFISILLKKENAINMYIFFVKIKIKLAKIKKRLYFYEIRSKVSDNILFIFSHRFYQSISFDNDYFNSLVPVNDPQIH